MFVPGTSNMRGDERFYINFWGGQQFFSKF